MAGSNSWQVYQSDNGQQYAIYCDKSNALAVNPSAQANPASLPNIGLPRGIQARYALFVSDDGLTRRKVPLLKPSDVAALQSTLNFVTDPGGVTVRISSIHGETIRLPRLKDTGLTT